MRPIISKKHGIWACKGGGAYGIGATPVSAWKDWVSRRVYGVSVALGDRHADALYRAWLKVVTDDGDFRREVAEAARVREDEPLADRLWARVTAYGNLNWRERPEDEMWVKEAK